MMPCRTLIVADEAMVAMDIEDRLVTMGCQLVGRASRGEQALALVEELRPNLVLMDIRLQGTMDGGTAAEEMRRRFHVPVIFVTAYAEDMAVERAKLAEPYGYLLKPFDDRELKSTIEIVLYKHRVEEEIRHLNRIYEVLSQVNQTIVRTQSRKVLLPEVCRVVVERGAIDLVWIGWLEPDRGHIKPVAHYGRQSELLDQTDFSAHEQLDAYSNPGQAIREGKSSVCNGGVEGACLCPVAQAFGQSRFQSCGSFPLRFQGQVCGVLNLCLTEPGFFHDREIALLEEVALDISYALDKIESDTQRDRLTEQLQRQSTFLQTLIDAMPYPVFYKNAHLRYLGCNSAFEQLLGLKQGQIIGKSVFDVWPQDLADIYHRSDLDVLAGKPLQMIETAVLSAAGSRYDVLSHKAPFQNPDGSSGGVIGAMVDITKRKQAEDALRQSEQRIRQKLDSILSPEGDIGGLELADFVDMPGVQSLLEDFYELAHFPACIVDLKGEVLAGAGWQDICALFHRTHPEASQHCLESDTQLTGGVRQGEFRLYKCKNHMWDIATPLMVGGHHLGNLFSGQFFFEDEQIDLELFRSQARRYGFNETAYMAALAKVPHLDRESVNTGMAFLVKLANMISLLSYSNINLARILTERAALTDSLRLSEAKYRTLFETMNQGVFYLGADGVPLDVNPAALRMLSLARKEFLKSTAKDVHRDVIHEDGSPFPAADHPSMVALKTGKPVQDVVAGVLNPQTKEYVWMIINAIPQFHRGETTPYRVFVTLHNITARKQVERTLRESELFLKETQKIARLGGYKTNPHTDYLKWTDGVYDIIEAPRDYTPGLTEGLKVYLPEYRSLLRESVTKCLATNEPFAVECQLATMTGEELWVEVRGLRSVVEGEKSYVVGTLQDITARRQAETALLKAARKWRSTFDSIRDGICLLDRKGRILQCNQAMTSLLGRPFNEIVGRAYWEVVTCGASFQEQSPVKHALESHQRETLLQQMDGAWFNITVDPILDDSGGLDGVVCIHADHTAIKRAEQELVASYEKLKHALTGTVEALSNTVELKDPYTSGHQRRVAHLACAIAEVLGFAPEQIEGISVLGYLHDIGKVAVPAEILSKPGKISEVEYKIIKTHPKIGYEILKNLDFPWPVAAAVLQHHERLDGSGYPEGLRGSQIIKEARILAVADVVEAMASHRPYRPALGLDNALNEISRNKGVLYDPQVVDACVHIFKGGYALA
jgi:PAS domain S-box-containing protein/putative nucleotidyltransferase with HDIG domain